MASIVTRHQLAEHKQYSGRILLAEDNPINQKVAATLLQRAGYSVDVVENGLQAVEAVRGKAYNLVLMDVQMPELDGLDATRKIRENEDKQTHLSIIAMTAHALKGDRERCLAAGMDDYLSKPLEPTEVLETIERWMSKDSAAPEPKAAAAGAEPAAEADAPTHPKLPVPALGADVDGPIQLERAMPRFGNDREFFVEMLTEFIESLPERVTELRAAAEAGDCPTLIKLAHTLKGTAANFSAAQLTAFALEIELQARAGQGSCEAGWNDKIEAEIPKLQAFLEGLNG
jgi:two-component system, sensor histidine kinase and response regulator